MCVRGAAGEGGDGESPERADGKGQFQYCFVLGAQRARSPLHTSTKQISESPSKIHAVPKITAMRSGKFTFAWCQAKSSQFVLGAKRGNTYHESMLWMTKQNSLVVSRQDPQVSGRIIETGPIPSGILMMNFNSHWI